MERRVAGGTDVELLRPAALEGDGVDEREDGAAVDHAGREQLGDRLGGVFGDPAVDGVARGFGAGLEVERLELGVILLAGGGEVLGAEREAGLAEEAVGGGQAVVAEAAADVE